MYLETERIQLFEFSGEDLELLNDLNADPEVMQYLTGKPASSDENFAALGRKIKLNRRYSGKFGFWKAYEKCSGEFMGWFHFRPDYNDPENLKRIELGYRLKRKFWGKGLATEGSLALIEKGFNELGVLEVYATTMENNIGSRKVMEKCGLSYVRSFEDHRFPESEFLDVEYRIVK